MSPQLLPNKSLTLDHIVKSIDIISSFHKVAEIHIRPIWITKKANWNLFVEKLRNSIDPESDASTFFGHAVQFLLQDINMPAILPSRSQKMD